eukprot:TRINITY_DN5681_c0_g1_i4.p2 TRINITY_DN5681_c0_g1~~TRINITY_DN5681_c0_g1_i4.p2  ORF type:complete len:136 (-),score=31.59 TRINITY_DN5681_c0_g1_i4:63-470(-)
MPRLYRAADAFVLPTRGEGWGLPIMEAMAMGLPVIATNYSGCTALVDDRVAYPLRVERLRPAGPMGGGHGEPRAVWAEPSEQHLRTLMRHVAAHPDEAAAKGALAREKVATQFCQECVRARIVERLSAINQQLHP